MNTLFGMNFSEIGILVLGIAYLLVFWKQGGSKASQDVITAYKEQVNLNLNKINDLTHEVGVLSGQLKEKEIQIQALQAIAKTTPEQEAYMADMRKFTVGVAEYMASSTKTMGEVSKFMESLSQSKVV